MSRVILLGENPLKEVAIGTVIGIGFIILNLLAPTITIGFPLLPQATQGEKIGVIGILAPIGEELAFRFILLNILLFMAAPLILILAIQMIAFSIFHAKVYAGALALQNITTNIGAFVGAGMFAVIVTLLAYYRKGFLAAIVVHMIFNIFLITKYFVVVAL